MQDGDARRQLAFLIRGIESGPANAAELCDHGLVFGRYAARVRRRIEAHPGVKGLTVLGMPKGAPGMDVPEPGHSHYRVLTISKDRPAPRAAGCCVLRAQSGAASPSDRTAVHGLGSLLAAWLSSSPPIDVVLAVCRRCAGTNWYEQYPCHDRSAHPSIAYTDFREGTGKVGFAVAAKTGRSITRHHSPCGWEVLLHSQRDKLLKLKAAGQWVARKTQHGNLDRSARAARHRKRAPTDALINLAVGLRLRHRVPVRDGFELRVHSVRALGAAVRRHRTERAATPIFRYPAPRR
jgi:hypothetical protein